MRKGAVGGLRERGRGQSLLLKSSGYFRLPPHWPRAAAPLSVAVTRVCSAEGPDGERAGPGPSRRLRWGCCSGRAAGRVSWAEFGRRVGRGKAAVRPGRGRPPPGLLRGKLRPDTGAPGGPAGKRGRVSEGPRGGLGSAGKRGRVSVMAPGPPGGPGCVLGEGLGARGEAWVPLLSPRTRPERAEEPGGERGLCPRCAPCRAGSVLPAGLAGPGCSVRSGGAGGGCFPAASALDTRPPVGLAVLGGCQARGLGRCCRVPRVGGASVAPEQDFLCGCGVRGAGGGLSERRSAPGAPRCPLPAPPARARVTGSGCCRESGVPVGGAALSALRGRGPGRRVPPGREPRPRRPVLCAPHPQGSHL